MFSLVVVEDNESILDGLVGYFLSEGVKTEGFSDGYKAAEYLKHHDVDIILSDVSMPSISGPQMFELIRSSQRSSPLLVYLTGQPRLDVNSTYLRGARAVLAKPISPKDLFHTLEFFYHEKQTERQLLQRATKQHLEALESLRMASFGSLASSYVHEINNALNILMGLAEVSLAKSESYSEPEKTTMIGVLNPIKQQISRIYSTIKALRSLFLETTELTFSNELLSDVVKEAIQYSQSKILEHKISIAFVDESDSSAVPCNKSLMTQVVVNLISNACDALSHCLDRQIIVKIAKDQSLARITVQDSGPGIPVSLRAELTKVGFTTKDGFTNTTSGLGLGLSICRKIAEAHRGNFYLDKDTDVTRFVFELPLVQQDSRK